MRNLIMSTAVVAFVAIGCGEKKNKRVLIQRSLPMSKVTYW